MKTRIASNVSVFAHFKMDWNELYHDWSESDPSTSENIFSLTAEIRPDQQTELLIIDD